MTALHPSRSDPRWGRLAETFGEDPLVNARMGAEHVRGLQGVGEAPAKAGYVKVGATAKVSGGGGLQAVRAKTGARCRPPPHTGHST